MQRRALWGEEEEFQGEASKDMGVFQDVEVFLKEYYFYFRTLKRFFLFSLVSFIFLFALSFSTFLDLLGRVYWIFFFHFRYFPPFHFCIFNTPSPALPPLPHLSILGKVSGKVYILRICLFIQISKHFCLLRCFVLFFFSFFY